MHALILLVLAAQQQVPCSSGQVVDVNRGKDYLLTLCGGAVVGLRGVEAPLYSAGGGMDGDVLGISDITPDALPQCVRAARTPISARPLKAMVWHVHC